METKSSKQFGASATNLWRKYCTDIFFRTTCHIILLQIILTAVVITGLWYVMEYLVRDTSETLLTTFAQMLQGQQITDANLRETLANVRLDQFWSVVIIATAVILSFGFVMVYTALTPTRRSLERKKRFISDISHELRTPLAIMRTNTDVALLNQDMPQKVRDMLQRNITEFDRVSEIMNNLLVLSNLTRYEHVRFEAVDMSAVAQRAMDTLTETLDNKDITLTLKSHTHQTVLGNAVALEQVAFNLIKNAIAHTNTDGVITIEVGVASDGKHIEFSVSDTGSGIARDDLFHIFEPFYRGRKAPRNGGRGLGLAIVNEIVQMHRGKIKIQSALGRGTTVVVSLKRSMEENGTSKGDTERGIEEVTVDFSHRVLT